MIEDYPYAGVDFRGDTNIPLPEGMQWGDLGNTLTLVVFLSFQDFFF